MKINILNYSSFQSNMPTSLKAINATIYYDMKDQIVRSPYNGRIDELNIIQWIEYNWKDKPYKNTFIEFASKYALVCLYSSQCDIWTAEQILNLLLNIEPLEADLNTRKAVFCSTLGNIKEAEKYHKRATNGRYSTAWVNYGYFLLKQKRDHEAMKMFETALKMSPLNMKSLIGMGRLIVSNSIVFLLHLCTL
eukprot:508475_1